jgi:GntR family transcriptional regulator
MSISGELMNALSLSQRTPLERGNGIPLYHQIRQQLLQQIRSRAFKSSDPIPSVQEIADRYGVSLMTARQAVRSLCDLGLIYSKQGKGTFISRTKVEKDFRQVLSFTDEMRLRGATTRSRLLSLRLQVPGQEVRKALELGGGDKVFRLHRVRYADGVPMGVECSCLPAALCPDLLQVFEAQASLYRTLTERYGIQLFTASETVEVGRVAPDEARLLRIAAKSPVFLFTRISFLENGKPAEYVKSTYRGDRYRIVNRLTRLKPDVDAPKSRG